MVLQKMKIVASTIVTAMVLGDLSNFFPVTQAALAKDEAYLEAITTEDPSSAAVVSLSLIIML